MAQKRSAAEIFEGDILESAKQPRIEKEKKHTLDSEEEDSGEDETFVEINLWPWYTGLH